MAAGGSKGTGSHDICTFRTGRCREVVEDLFYQFVKKLEDMSETDHKTVYIDGTKLESAAGRYNLCVAQTHPKAPGEGKGGTGKTNRAEERFRHRFHAGGRTASYPFRTRKRQTQKSRSSANGRTMDACWNAGKHTNGSWPSWARAATAIPKQIRDATFMRMKEDHMRKRAAQNPGITSRSQSTANTSRVWRCSQTAATQRRSVP